jgi:phage gp36-like protein
MMTHMDHSERKHRRNAFGDAAGDIDSHYGGSVERPYETILALTPNAFQ